MNVMTMIQDSPRMALIRLTLNDQASSSEMSSTSSSTTSSSGGTLLDKLLLLLAHAKLYRAPAQLFLLEHILEKELVACPEK